MKNKRLIGYRKMAGFSQEDLANRIGMVQATYSRKESGKANFDEKEIKTIHDVLKEKIPELTITDIFFTSNIQ